MTVLSRCSRVVALTLLGLACADPPTSPLGGRLPVIQGLLIADSAEHAFTITWSAGRVDSPGPLEPEPVEPADVALTLELPDGASAGVRPVAESPGRFVVKADVRPFERFRLHGSVAGIPVEAFTQLPGPLVIVLPDTDTTRILSPDPLETRRFPFVWAAPQAGAYFPLPAGAASFPSDLTSGEITFWSDTPDTVAFTILAVDSASAAFYGSGTLGVPRGNIRGALGVFGGATSARRVFLWVR